MSRETVKDECEPELSIQPKMRMMAKLQHRNKLDYLDRGKSVANIEDMPLEGTDALI